MLPVFVITRAGLDACTVMITKNLSIVTSSRSWTQIGLHYLNNKVAKCQYAPNVILGGKFVIIRSNVFRHNTQQN